MGLSFSWVIIDEAAQCVELDTLIPLKYNCTKCVLVGDPQQLPATILSDTAKRFNYDQSLFQRYQVYVLLQPGQGARLRVTRTSVILCRATLWPTTLLSRTVGRVLSC
jgi:hypothetical protein